MGFPYFSLKAIRATFLSTTSRGTEAIWTQKAEWLVKVIFGLILTGVYAESPIVSHRLTSTSMHAPAVARINQFHVYTRDQIKQAIREDSHLTLGTGCRNALDGQMQGPVAGKRLLWDICAPQNALE